MPNNEETKPLNSSSVSPKLSQANLFPRNKPPAFHLSRSRTPDRHRIARLTLGTKWATIERRKHAASKERPLCQKKYPLVKQTLHRTKAWTSGIFMFQTKGTFANQPCVNKKMADKQTAAGHRLYPRWESNSNLRFRRALFYPLNYKGNVFEDKITLFFRIIRARSA